MLAHAAHLCLVLSSLHVASSFTLQLSRHSSLRELQQYTFSRFVKDFGRAYEQGTDEWSERERLFKTHLQEVLDFQSGPPRSWAKGVTQFMDYTEAEYRALLGYKGSKPSLASVRSSSMGLISQREDPSSMPSFVKVAVNTSLGRLVRDQGACGSCWAEAATSVLEGHMVLNEEVMAKLTLEASVVQDVPTLSSQAMVSCTENPRHCGGTGGCQGATAELAYEMVKQNGLPLAVKWPYASGGGVSPSCRHSVFSNWRVGITGYDVLPQNKLNPLKRALVASGGPVVVSVDASGWSFYLQGIYSDGDGGRPGEFTVNHAVTLMGFRDPMENSQGYWLIKNSWGGFWGEEGFIRLQMKSNEEEHCGWDYSTHEGLACDGDPDKAWVCGTCGVLYDSTYPTGIHLKQP